ncbi:CheY-like chemotaxis protein [Brevundimonas alba]|uniref:CheY-like chemotaxis protein n=1 Tax=Brevundimonas alba TaxID=74314 RepID=A0A7X5YN69_9CAUL|nr:response regulator [Brevundimonas alba]NJC41724.1 CheY-like chemotaxis protein [Brevundimonas alba]
MSAVLIVEDDEDKAERLSEYMISKYIVADLKLARSLQSGLRLALAGTFDLMLLDMTMTNYDRSLSEDGGRPHHFAGREILRRLQREEVHVPAIVVTQLGRFGEEAEQVTLSELKEELNERFEDYLGTVHYQSNVDDWKDQLDELIGQRLSARGS